MNAIVAPPQVQVIIPQVAQPQPHLSVVIHPVRAARFQDPHLAWSLFNVFCFPVCGILALFYSIRTCNMNYQSQFELAREFSKTSEILNAVATTAAVVTFIGLGFYFTRI